MEINQDYINNKLKNVGNKLLKTPYKEKWSTENPTYGYCYVISESLYHYYYPSTYPFYINMGCEGVHWFLKDDNGNIIDFTANQFKNTPDYSKAKRGTFFKGSIVTSKGFISKRGYEVARVIGVI